MRPTRLDPRLFFNGDKLLVLAREFGCSAPKLTRGVRGGRGRRVRMPRRPRADADTDTDEGGSAAVNLPLAQQLINNR